MKALFASRYSLFELLVMETVFALWQNDEYSAAVTVALVTFLVALFALVFLKE